VVDRLETGSRMEQDQGMNAVEVGDPCSIVRKMLEEIAPCETGYVGVVTCKTCGGYWCADILEKALEEKDPSMDWRPAIREVLGLW
jgi:hypothetical protein